MKIAIVHDFLNQYGGAEKVVETLHEIYPDAPIYTSFHVPENLTEQFKGMKIITSFMRRFPGMKRHFKKYFFFYPLAFSSFDLSGYDMVLSSSSAFAKGVRVPPGAVHICYCYTPARFIWKSSQYFEKENIGRPLKAVIRIAASLLKRWDVRNSKRVDYFVAISQNIQNRIEHCYGRKSEVIYPPVETAKFMPNGKSGDYYLIVSRLNAYKRIDIVVRAFNKLGLPLRIIGEGPYASVLMKFAGPNVEFLGRLSNEDVIKNVSACRALIFPGEEDFGIAPVEAQAAGRHVVAYAAGGALETVVDGVTGVFFREQTADSVEKAVTELERKMNSFDASVIRDNALRFDRDVFKEQLKRFIATKYAERKGKAKEALKVAVL